MGRLRLALAVALAAATAAALWWALPSDEAPGAAGTYNVTVTGPDGTIFAGAVWSDAGTALDVLWAAADEGDFEVRVREYPGPACGSYVWSIDGHAERGAGGWVFEVLDAATGTWWYPCDAACGVTLRPGDEVAWQWIDGGDDACDPRPTP